MRKGKYKPLTNTVYGYGLYASRVIAITVKRDVANPYLRCCCRRVVLQAPFDEFVNTYELLLLVVIVKYFISQQSHACFVTFL